MENKPSTQISALGLSTHAYNVLNAHNIHTVEDYCLRPREWFARFYQVGYQTFSEWETAIAGRRAVDRSIFRLLRRRPIILPAPSILTEDEAQSNPIELCQRRIVLEAELAKLKTQMAAIRVELSQVKNAQRLHKREQSLARYYGNGEFDGE